MIELVELIMLLKSSYKKENMLQVFITFGEKKPKNLFSYLLPTFQDLLTLEKHGMSVQTYDGQTFDVKAFVVAVIGDFPAMSELIAHKTHASTYGCRICKVEGVSRENKRGFSFVGSDEAAQIRRLIDFDVQEVSSNRRRLKNTS